MMPKFIPYGRQNINEEDISAVVETLRSDWLTTGPKVEQFESEVAKYCDAKYAVAVANATAALHISALALELGEGDGLWTSPNTFVASANCGLYCGAKVDFVDIDPHTHNMSVAHLQKKLERGQIPKIVVPVHFSGQSCDMSAIADLAQKYGFRVIEDASHAIGGEYLGRKIGNGQYSDITVMSFHPVKVMTTGEGGICLTNDKELYWKLKALRSHGIVRGQEDLEDSCHGDWYYEQKWLGFNYRLTDLQCALGLSQLKRLDQFISRRREIVQRYNDELSGNGLILPCEEAYSKSAWHLYVIRVPKEKSGDRRRIYEQMKSAHIGVNVHYIPVHTQPFYKKMGFKLGDFPIAEEFYRSAISLPIYYGLSKDEQDYVIRTLKACVDW